jgi:hypothetical protein
MAGRCQEAPHGASSWPESTATIVIVRYNDKKLFLLGSILGLALDSRRTTDENECISYYRTKRSFGQWGSEKRAM